MPPRKKKETTTKPTKPAKAKVESKKDDKVTYDKKSSNKIELEIDITKSPTFIAYMEEKEKYDNLSPEKQERQESMYHQRQIHKLMFLQLMLKINNIQ